MNRKRAVDLNISKYLIKDMKGEQVILQKLENIEKNVEEIKQHMVDVDTILTAEERVMLDESIKHEKEGKLVSLKDIENVRNKAR